MKASARREAKTRNPAALSPPNRASNQRPKGFSYNLRGSALFASQKSFSKPDGFLGQFGVAAVAERAVLGMLAAAPRDRLGHGDVHLQRREAGAFVRAVAERLARSEERRV